MTINAIIPAGGTSSRFGNTNKLLEKINGKEVIRYTVEAFLRANVDKIIICANAEIIEELEKIFKNGKSGMNSEASPLQGRGLGRGGDLDNNMLGKYAQHTVFQLSTFNFQPDTDLTNLAKIVIIEGGATRQESVYNGLKHSKCDYVLIHDGARPMISTDLINQAIETVKDKKALTIATKTIDTIKEVIDGKIVRTIDRSKLYNTQTPQAFEYNLIKSAHEKLIGRNFTDDAGMLEELGYDVYILNGSYKNIKITTKNDIDIAKVYLK